MAGLKDGKARGRGDVASRPAALASSGARRRVPSLKEIRAATAGRCIVVLERNDGGAVATGMAGVVAGSEDRERQAADRAPMRRLATIDDVGAAADLPTSGRTCTITGQTLRVGAGIHILAARP